MCLGLQLQKVKFVVIIETWGQSSAHFNSQTGLPFFQNIFFFRYTKDNFLLLRLCFCFVWYSCSVQLTCAPCCCRIVFTSLTQLMWPLKDDRTWADCFSFAFYCEATLSCFVTVLLGYTLYWKINF